MATGWTNLPSAPPGVRPGHSHLCPARSASDGEIPRFAKREISHRWLAALFAGILTKGPCHAYATLPLLPFHPDVVPGGLGRPQLAKRQRPRGRAGECRPARSRTLGGTCVSRAGQRHRFHRQLVGPQRYHRPGAGGANSHRPRPRQWPARPARCWLVLEPGRRWLVLGPE
jgi:hypothetical protein